MIVSDDRPLDDHDDLMTHWLANAVRQARQGKPYDEWDWDTCSRLDAYRARQMRRAAEAMLDREGDHDRAQRQPAR